MSAWTERWRDRSATERFDLYMRVSLYLLCAAEAFFALAIAANATHWNQPWVAVFLAVAAVHATLGVLDLRRGVDWFLNRASRPTGLNIGVLVVGAVGVAASVLAFHDDAAIPPDGDGATGTALLMFSGLTIVATSPQLGGRGFTAAALASGVLVSGVTASLGWPTGRAMFIGGWSVLIIALFAGSCRLSVWMLGVVWELHHTRDVQARLAVAEERLRIARDLHDVVGQKLSVIALKSELSAELARRGRPGATDEMTEVQRIAQDTLTEVREVVRGYRATDLPAELAGARGVLGSAGVRTRVLGDGSDLPREVQDVFAWVVREGTTNVLRHSEAAACTITVAVEPGADGSTTASLMMENDGVGDASSGDEPGSGLSGLAERLHMLGGGLQIRAERDRFRLVAAIPLGEAEKAENTGETGNVVAVAPGSEGGGLPEVPASVGSTVPGASASETRSSAAPSPAEQPSGSRPWRRPGRPGRRDGRGSGHD